MTAREAPLIGPEMQAAIDELKAIILGRYPETAFRVTPSPEEGDAVHLKAIVDVEDTDDVVDLVIDRMMQMQIDDGLLIYVVPVRTPERRAAAVAAGTNILGTA